jgi:phosphoserine phosphatase
MHVSHTPIAMKNARLSFDLDATALQNIPGMPHERMARVAARRVFVEMKQCFMESAAGLQGASAALLQRQLRIAGDIGELLELSETLLAVLPPEQCKAVRRQLDAAFPMAGRDTEFVPL